MSSQQFPEQIELIESDFLNSDYSHSTECPLYRALYRYGIRDFRVCNYGAILSPDRRPNTCRVAQYDWDWLKHWQAEKTRVFPVIVRRQN